MKKLAILCLSLLIAGLHLTAFASPAKQSLDQIVAIVNDDVVTRSEFNQAMHRVKIQIAQEHAPVPTEAVLRKQVIDQLVNRKLQLQIAKQNNIRVPEADLNKAIERVAKQNNMSVSTLYARIAQDGIAPAEYRNEVRDQMTLQKLQQQEVAGRITVSQQEITDFMRSKPWEVNVLKEYHLEDILIPTSDSPSPNEIQQATARAQAVLANAQKGTDIKQMPQAEVQTGDLGWRKLTEIPSAFADQVARMKVNEIAGPIRTSNGFHLIKLVAIRNLGNQQQIPSRKQVENLLLQRKFEEAVQHWVSKLRSQAFVVIEPEKSNV